MCVLQERYPAPNADLELTRNPHSTASTSAAGAVSQAEYPVIGITSQVTQTSKWYKVTAQLGFKAIEINRRNSKLHLNTFYLEKIKRYLQGLQISLHSATTGIFQALETFSNAEMAVLRAEVDIARVLGAGELIFHINTGRLDADNIKRLRPIFATALQSGVLPIYESDAGFNAKQALKVLDIFPEIGYALDLGHLNNGCGRNLLGCSIDTFIEATKHRIVYIHANNNDGIRDQHLGLEQGSLNWRAVLGQIDLSQVRKIIIEVSSADYIHDSQRALRHYLAKRMSPAANS